MSVVHSTDSGRFAVTHDDDGYRVTDTATWRSTVVEFLTEAIVLAEYAEDLDLPVHPRSAAA
jgi:hypothetical protein